ncbi:LexA family protein [Erwinia typographi]|uniref:LexA family protein n=1 Tax=Erwinia typographi TaxID=371042 RepID=UPI0018DE6911|nr:LexA family transcriptional regulator [Erwinia typographi]
MKYITKTQQDTLDFIRACIRDNGLAPTLREIADGMGWKSANSADQAVAALIRKGFLKRRRGTSRGLVLTNSATVDIPDVNSGEYWFDGVFQHQRYERDVYKVIEACGLKGIKKSWSNGQEVLNDH